MGVALVYLGEHYVLDLVIGGVYAVIAYVAANAIVDRWRRRRGLATVDREPSQADAST